MAADSVGKAKYFRGDTPGHALEAAAVRTLGWCNGKLRIMARTARSSVRSSAATSSWNDVSGSGAWTTLTPLAASGAVSFAQLDPSAQAPVDKARRLHHSSPSYCS